MADHFFIVCLSEKSREGSALFWKPECKGYTSSVEQAGLFTKEFAEKIEKSTHKENVAVEKSKLNNYFTCYTIACFDSQTLEKLGVKF